MSAVGLDGKVSDMTTGKDILEDRQVALVGDTRVGGGVGGVVEDADEVSDGRTGPVGSVELYVGAHEYDVGVLRDGLAVEFAVAVVVVAEVLHIGQGVDFEGAVGGAVAGEASSDGGGGPTVDAEGTHVGDAPATYGNVEVFRESLGGATDGGVDGHLELVDGGEVVVAEGGKDEVKGLDVAFTGGGTVEGQAVAEGEGDGFLGVVCGSGFRGDEPGSGSLVVLDVEEAVELQVAAGISRARTGARNAAAVARYELDVFDGGITAGDVVELDAHNAAKGMEVELVGVGV